MRATEYPRPPDRESRPVLKAAPGRGRGERQRRSGGRRRLRPGPAAPQRDEEDAAQAALNVGGTTRVRHALVPLFRGREHSFYPGGFSTISSIFVDKAVSSRSTSGLLPARSPSGNPQPHGSSQSPTRHPKALQNLLSPAAAPFHPEMLLLFSEPLVLPAMPYRGGARYITYLIYHS